MASPLHHGSAVRKLRKNRKKLQGFASFFFLVICNLILLRHFFKSDVIMIIILAVILIALSYIVAIYRLLNVIPLHGPRPQGKFKKQRAQQESKSASGSQGLRSVVV